MVNYITIGPTHASSPVGMLQKHLFQFDQKPYHPKLHHINIFRFIYL